MSRARPHAADFIDPQEDEQWDFFPPPLPVTEPPQAPIDHQPRLISAAQAAQAQGVSTRTLRRWEKAGRLAPRRVGRALFYLVDDVDRAIAAEITARALGTKAAPPSRISHAAHPQQNKIFNQLNFLISGCDRE